MHRIYVPSKNISLHKIILRDKKQAHHLKDVLRLRAASEVIIFDQEGREYLSILEELSSQGIVFAIKSRLERRRNNISLTLACAIPKAGGMDEIVDKLTQLGAERIIPLLSQRVVVRMDKQKKAARQERWEKIALSASRQSQRNTLPVIEPVREMEEFLCREHSFDLKLIPTLAGERRGLKQVISGCRPRSIIILIGPEGDFTAEEVEAARKKGFIPVSLGDLVLRVETAALAVASFIRLYAES